METMVQPKISGYRQLSAEEVALMERAKRLEQEFHALIADVKHHVKKQRTATIHSENDPDESKASEALRLDDAEPERWLAMGRTDIQTGVMKVCRAVAQPTTIFPKEPR